MLFLFFFLFSVIYFIKYLILHYSHTSKVFKENIYYLIEKRKMSTIPLHFHNHLVLFIKVTKGYYSVILPLKFYIKKHFFCKDLFTLEHVDNIRVMEDQ